jgi:hypothetical protein
VLDVVFQGSELQLLFTIDKVPAGVTWQVDGGPERRLELADWRTHVILETGLSNRAHKARIAFPKSNREIVIEGLIAESLQ